MAGLLEPRSARVRHPIWLVAALCVATFGASARFWPASARAVQVPRFFGDGAVLQQNTAWKLWGRAEPGERIAVWIDGKRVGRTTARSRQWSLSLPAQPGGGPHRVEIIGSSRIVLQDVYFGDVWIASGQSNMELPMARVRVKYPHAVAEASLPQVRYFRTPKEADFAAPRFDFSGGKWQRVTPKSVLGMSAVSFFFARSLVEKHPVPIGIIDNSYGGSAVESWMSEEALKAYPAHLEQALRYRDEAYLAALVQADEKKNQAWFSRVNAGDAGLTERPRWFEPAYSPEHWGSVALPGLWRDQGVSAGNGVVWFRRPIRLPPSAAKRPATLVLGRIVDADTAYVNGVEVGHTTYQYPPRRYEVPAGVLRAGENTIAVRVTSTRGSGGFVVDKPYELLVGSKKYRLAGSWQYRVGIESEPLKDDAYVSYKAPLGFHNALLAPLANLRIRGVLWYQGETNTGNPEEYASSFPAMIRDWRKLFGQGSFPFLFVQLASFLPASPQPVESQWAATREAQRKALAEPNTAMVVAIDAGEWNDIHPLDKKSVGERLALAARKVAYGEDIVYSGPMIRSMRVRGGQAVLSFDHVGGGLVHRGDRLRGFAVAGEQGPFVWARATVEGDEVVVESRRVPRPARVRYAWADNPDKANLYNREGLPASPFEVRAQPK